MLRKIAAAGLIAGAALAFSAGPALANNSGDQTFNQNLQLVPITVCNANVGVLGAAVPILSPQTVVGGCTNGPIQTAVVDSDRENGNDSEHDSGEGDFDHGYDY